MERRKLPVKNCGEESFGEKARKPIRGKKPNEIEEDESESMNNLSEYEKLRLKNIEERDRFMRSLGFDKALEELNELTKIHAKAKHANKAPRIKVKKEPLPKREPSKRLQNLAALAARAIKKRHVKEEKKDERFKGCMPMRLRDKELLKRLKDLKEDVTYDGNIDLKCCSLDDFQECMTGLQMPHESFTVVPERIQSILVHPSANKKLVIAGDVNGSLGLWDVETGGSATFRPHTASINCISVSKAHLTKIYTAGHDGVLACADLELNFFSNLYATDFSDKIRHMTWLDEIDYNQFLIAHGNGSVGIVDVRGRKAVKRWIKCFEKSARTVHHHPTNNNYFLVSSGACLSAQIYDIRSCSESKAEAINRMDHPKGLFSAFFSPSGDRVLTTCNDHNLRIFTNPLGKKPIMSRRISHNNRTGSSFFNAMWHPARNDIFTIGSLLFPRRIQMYGIDGKIVGELKDDKMKSASPFISAHPTLPFIVGGNMSNKVNAFLQIKHE